MDYDGFLSFEAIGELAERAASEHPDLVRVQSLGRSPEGRSVRAVHVSEDVPPASEKQVVLIVCGRHGNELGTRVVGPALIEWLLSDEGAETRRRQTVIIVPVANPDGCVREEFHAPPRHLSELEQNTIVALARTHKPDAIIDVHSFGPHDADLQAIVTGNNTGEAEDLPIYHAVAAEMIAGAAAAGFPFVLHTEKRNEGYNNFISGYCYDHFHTVAFGLEVNHHALSPAEAARSAVTVIGALLRQGNARWPWEQQRGYPANVLKGDFFTSIRPAGGNAAERRVSRAAIWANRRFYYVGQREMLGRHMVRIAAGWSGYSADIPTAAFTLCCRLRGFPNEVRVRLNGEPVDADTFEDECSTYVSVAIRPTRKEDYEIAIEF